MIIAKNHSVKFTVTSLLILVLKLLHLKWHCSGTMIFGAILLHLSEQGDVIHLREVAELDEKLKQSKPNF